MNTTLSIAHRNVSRRIGLCGMLAVAATAVLLAGCGQTPSASTTLSATAAAKVAARHASAAATAAEVAKLLASAQRAYAEHKVIAPAGDNAIEYYVAVLAKDPGNPVAKGALLEIFPYGVPYVRDAIAGGNFDEASREIALLAKADPRNYTVELLRSQLAARSGRSVQAATATSADVSGSHVLVVHASADAWVEVAGVDGGKVESGVLGAGESRTYRSTGQLKVTLGNANAVSVTADGKPIDVERFRRGRVAHLVAFVEGARGNGLAATAQSTGGRQAL